MTSPSMTATTPTDEQLWRASRAGDRDAFGQLVERYQSLIAAIAYSRSGDLAAASDFAQETFITAWRGLTEPREPGRLREWLCGIVRNLTASAARRVQRRGGAPAALDEIVEPRAPVHDPEAQAITQQEQELLWRALAMLPESYREPLVLFYREEQSVREVAHQLGLSEQTVRQRLSRGRALLREELSTLVTVLLARSRPGATFTAGVLAAIATTTPAGAVVVTAAGVGSASLSGTSAASAGKSVAAGLSGAALAGPATGLLTAWLAARLAGAAARSDAEKQLILRGFRQGVGFALPMVLLLLASIYVALARFAESPALLALVTTVWTGTLLVGLALIATRLQRRIAELRRVNGTDDAAWDRALTRRGLAPARAKHYRTRARLFGLPLFAFASAGLDVGASYERRAGRAVGWVACGDLALSPLLAIGGVAVAPIAIGGVSVGLLALSVGGVGLGALAVGSLAFGWVAVGVVAVAWRAAAGATAIAHDLAIGGQARALEVNNALAATWFREAWFTPLVTLFVAAIPVLVLLAIVIPLGLMARRAWVLRRLRPVPEAPVQVARATSTTPERWHGLDALRALALLLGVVLHASMPYVLPPGLWAVGTTTPQPWLGWLAYVIHSFRMEAFFLLAGFFGAHVVAKRGLRAYLADRGWRVVLVLLVALYPMKVALTALWIAGGRATGWLRLTPEAATRPLHELTLGALALERFPAIGTTHLWFLFYLSGVTALFLLARAVVRRLLPQRACRAVSAALAAVLDSAAAPLALALAATPLLAGMAGADVDTPDRTLVPHLPVTGLYLLYFALGWWLDSQRPRLERLIARGRMFSLLGLAASVPASIGVGLRYEAMARGALVSDGWRWASSFGTALTGAALVLGLLGLCLRRFSEPTPGVRALADASYFIYLAHLPLVVGLQVLLAAHALPWWLAVPLVCAATIGLLLPFHWWVVRPTWIGAWLSGRRRPTLDRAATAQQAP
jgi:RNA polymerase sigma factor (sigma-70 family)